MNTTKFKHEFLARQWAQRIVDFKNSGLPLKEWLLINNLSRDQYFYWKRKLSDGKRIYTDESRMEGSKSPQLLFCNVRFQDIQSLFDLIRSLTRKSQDNYLLIRNLLFIMKIHDVCDKNRCLADSHIDIHKAGIALVENRCFLVFI